MANVNDTGLTPSTIKLKRIMGTSPAYRMLTPYEIELLRKSKQEVAEVVGQMLAKKNNNPPSENAPLESDSLYQAPAVGASESGDAAARHDEVLYL